MSGATGFIGGHLVRRLVARGEEVIVLTRDADKAVSCFGPRQTQSLTNYGLRPEHLERRVYMLDPDGRILSGLPALIELCLRMPGYGWLAKLFSIPLLHPVAATLYDQVVAPSLARWARLRARNWLTAVENDARES